MSAGFEAQYSGDCARCDLGITPGQRIRMVDLGLGSAPARYAHVACPTPRPVVRCDVCWQLKAANGSCGCPT